MTHTRWIPRFVVLAALLMLGCSSDHLLGPPPPPPPPPGSDTPQHAIQRFVFSYEQKLVLEYQGMFTGDFTYEFSNSADPDLVTKYSTGWFRGDEELASFHLFHGYTPPGGEALPAARVIDINLATAIPVDDNGSADPLTHKVLFTRVDGLAEFPPPSGETDPLSFVIANNQNAFYLVRGDAAVGLDPASQPADDQHWYIYRWVDLTQPEAIAHSAAGAPMPTQPATWGHLKAIFR